LDHLFATKVKPRHFKKAIGEHRRLAEEGIKGDGETKAGDSAVTELEDTVANAV
jgi:hypothetical protein